MKVVLLILGVLLFAAPAVQANTPHVRPASKTCLDHLAWQRWSYTKAHIDVTQSIREIQPKQTVWRQPGSQRDCRLALRSARSLQRTEVEHWQRLRMQKQGVKWIIRRQFRLAGRSAVLKAWQVVSCESNFRPYARSSTGDVGIWQINQVHGIPDSITTSPELSTGWAWRASSHGTNFSPTWVCAGHYGIA